MENTSEPRRCVCGSPQLLANDPNCPVEYNAPLNEYTIHSLDRHTYYMMYHCTMCGGWISDSTRDQLFSKPDETEVSKAIQLVQHARSMSEVRSVLGAPDEEIILEGKSHVPTASQDSVFLRQYRFCSMWKSFDLNVLEAEDGSVRFSIVGKRLPDEKKS